jgi:hypothetical protein
VIILDLVELKLSVVSNIISISSMATDFRFDGHLIKLEYLASVAEVEKNFSVELHDHSNEP